MKRSLFLFLLAICSAIVSAQSDTIRIKKPLNIWVFTKDNKEQRGVLTGSTVNTLLIYPGSMKDYKNQVPHQSVSISYENIDIIKTKRPNGLLSGLATGALIGALPVVFGQGGGFVAIITFPLGAITGSIVGATSKKKYIINGDLNEYHEFTRKAIK